MAPMARSGAWSASVMMGVPRSARGMRSAVVVVDVVVVAVREAPAMAVEAPAMAVEAPAMAMEAPARAVEAPARAVEATVAGEVPASCEPIKQGK